MQMHWSEFVSSSNMSCNGEVVLGIEEGLFLLPSNLFNEIFHDCVDPFPQGNRGSSYYDTKPRKRYLLNHYGSMERPSDDASVTRMKPRGTGVFLPKRPLNSSEEYSLKKKPHPMISSSHSRQVFLPKEWAY